MSFVLNYADFGPNYWGPWACPLYEPHGWNIGGARAPRASWSRCLWLYCRDVIQPKLLAWENASPTTKM